jgi:hypothetical protein
LSTLFSDDEDDIPALATVDHCEDDEDYPMDDNDLTMASEPEVNTEACAGASNEEDTVPFQSIRPRV